MKGEKAQGEITSRLPPPEGEKKSPFVGFAEGNRFAFVKNVKLHKTP